MTVTGWQAVCVQLPSPVSSAVQSLSTWLLPLPAPPTVVNGTYARVQDWPGYVRIEGPVLHAAYACP
jgi:hypothetical protein